MPFSPFPFLRLVGQHAELTAPKYAVTKCNDSLHLEAATKNGDPGASQQRGRGVQYIRPVWRAICNAGLRDGRRFPKSRGAFHALDPDKVSGVGSTQHCSGLVDVR